MGTDERIAYMNGLATGYSSGYRGAINWFTGIGSCRIGSASIPPPPTHAESDIYALDYWIYEYLYTSGRLLNVTSSSVVFVPASTRQKHRLIVSNKDKTFIVNDFGPFCRYQRLGEHANVRFILMSPGDGGCRKSKTDIISPHTVYGARTVETTERNNHLFFYGHLPKPYIKPGISELRYRMYATLHGMPRSMVGSYNVEENVNALTTTDRTQWCRQCSYACKTCYYSTTAPRYRNTARINANEYRQWMQSSTFCIVARGDNPGCPKLAESIVFGCIPIIVMDQQLPYENELNYSLFSLRFDPRMILNDPFLIRRTLSRVTENDILEMRRELSLVSDIFAVRPGGTPFSVQGKLTREMC